MEVYVATGALALVIALVGFWRFQGGRTAAVMLLLLLIALANFEVAAMQAHYVCTRMGCSAPPLSDRGFDVIADQSSNAVVVAAVDVTPTLLVGFLYTLLARSDATVRDVALLSFFFGLFARMLVMPATGMPAAKEGNALIPLFEALASEKLRDMLGLSPPPAENRSHFDLLFSGHEFCSVLAFLWILHVAGADSGAPLALAALFALAQGVGLVAIRIHYTADVLIGAILAVLVFVVASRVVLPWARIRDSANANVRFYKSRGN